MQINFVWAEFSGYIYNFYYGRSGKDYEFKWPDENRSREKSVVAGRQVRIWRNIQNLEKYRWPNPPMKRILGSRGLNLIGERQTLGCVFKMAVFNLLKHASSH